MDRQDTFQAILNKQKSDNIVDGFLLELTLFCRTARQLLEMEIDKRRNDGKGD